MALDATDFRSLLDQLWSARVAGGVSLFVLTLVGSVAVTAAVLCRLPTDYLVRRTDELAPCETKPGWTTSLKKIGKNLLGGLLILIGLILSLPGVPGQGVLTVLLGVMLLDVPGKHRLERRIMSRPAVLRAINRLRARFGKEPIVSPTLPV